MQNGCLNFDKKRGHIHINRKFFLSKKKVVGAKSNKTWAKAINQVLNNSIRGSGGEGAREKNCYLTDTE